MRISDEVRRLGKKWATNAGWPKRLEWLEIHNLRGWTGQRVEFKYPIVAIVGENGSGKSTIIQAAASVYRGERSKTGKFASEFFPSTAWDKVENAVIRYGYRQADSVREGRVSKPTSRWLGNVKRPIRAVSYIDLTRIQPVSARVGYAKIAKTKHRETSAEPFDQRRVQRLSEVLGRSYDAARMALSNVDAKRYMPVLSKKHASYSGFHQGAGETTIAELLQADMPKCGLILIDEIESSLHPRAQRRLIRDLAARCRDSDLQILLTTHSPYVLEELPQEARIHILETKGGRQIVEGVSPQFAMTKMDDEPHPECDLYVEDDAARVMLNEILARHAKNLFPRCVLIPSGASSVGMALGQMVTQKRFPRPSCVFLDGDNAITPGCSLMPGGDAPERVVFEALSKTNWGDVWSHIKRDTSEVTDACEAAMTLGDHHEWVRSAANQLMCGGDVLWQAMCAEWSDRILQPHEADEIVKPIEDALNGLG